MTKLYFLRKIQKFINLMKWVYDLRMMTIQGFMRFTAASIIFIGIVMAILTIEIL